MRRFPSSRLFSSISCSKPPSELAGSSSTNSQSSSAASLPTKVLVFTGKLAARYMIDYALLNGIDRLRRPKTEVAVADRPSLMTKWAKEALQLSKPDVIQKCLQPARLEGGGGPSTSCNIAQNPKLAVPSTPLERWAQVVANYQGSNVASPTAALPYVEKFLAWCKHQGIIISPLVGLRYIEGKGLCLVAQTARKIPAGVPLALVPIRSCVHTLVSRGLTADTISCGCGPESPRQRQDQEEWAYIDAQLNFSERLGLELLRHLNDSSSSLNGYAEFLYDHLRQFPVSNLPFLGATSELKSSLFRHEQRQFEDRVYHFYRSPTASQPSTREVLAALSAAVIAGNATRGALPKPSAHGTADPNPNSILSPRNFKESDFRWAVSTVFSRSFQWPVPGCVQHSHSAHALVPFIDLVNHGEQNCNASIQYFSGLPWLHVPSEQSSSSLLGVSLGRVELGIASFMGGYAPILPAGTKLSSSEQYGALISIEEIQDGEEITHLYSAGDPWTTQGRDQWLSTWGFIPSRGVGPFAARYEQQRAKSALRYFFA